MRQKEMNPNLVSSCHYIVYQVSCSRMFALKYFLLLFYCFVSEGMLSLKFLIIIFINRSASVCFGKLHVSLGKMNKIILKWPTEYQMIWRGLLRIREWNVRFSMLNCSQSVKSTNWKGSNIIVYIYSNRTPLSRGCLLYFVETIFNASHEPVQWANWSFSIYFSLPLHLFLKSYSI